MTSDAAVRAEVEARVGTVLARKYRIERVLGIGGMGAVYAAAHRNGARVAVKVLHRAYTTHDDVLKRFLREGSLANRIAHPAVVRIVDDHVADDGSVFLVMELLRGATCRELADRRGGRMDLREALVVAHRVLGALEAAHREGVIHRDIKPNNVFVTSAGEVKLLDFGVARLREGDALYDGATRTGMTLGTPGFMCPEQALGHTASIDARSDIWGAGAMLFNLLTGEHVHPGSTAQEVVVFTATRPVRGLGEVLDVDPRVAAVVDRALALAPGDRFPGAGEMRAALESAYAGAFGAPVDGASVDGPASERVQLGYAPTAIATRAGAGVATLDPEDSASVAARTSGTIHDAAGPFASATPAEGEAGALLRPSRRGRVAGAVRFAIVGAVIAGAALGAVALRRGPAPLPSASTGVADAPAVSPSPPAAASVQALPATTAPVARVDSPAGLAVAQPVAAAARKSAGVERPKAARGGESARAANRVNGPPEAPPSNPPNPPAPARDALHDLDFR